MNMTVLHKIVMMLFLLLLGVPYFLFTRIDDFYKEISFSTFNGSTRWVVSQNYYMQYCYVKKNVLDTGSIPFSMNNEHFDYTNAHFFGSHIHKKKNNWITAYILDIFPSIYIHNPLSNNAMDHASLFLSVDQALNKTKSYNMDAYMLRINQELKGINSQLLSIAEIKMNLSQVSKKIDNSICNQQLKNLILSANSVIKGTISADTARIVSGIEAIKDLLLQYKEKIETSYRNLQISIENPVLEQRKPVEKDKKIIYHLLISSNIDILMKMNIYMKYSPICKYIESLDKDLFAPILVYRTFISDYLDKLESTLLHLPHINGFVSSESSFHETFRKIFIDKLYSSYLDFFHYCNYAIDILTSHYLTNFSPNKIISFELYYIQNLETYMYEQIQNLRLRKKVLLKTINAIKKIEKLNNWKNEEASRTFYLNNKDATQAMKIEELMQFSNNTAFDMFKYHENQKNDSNIDAWYSMLIKRCKKKEEKKLLVEEILIDLQNYHKTNTNAFNKCYNAVFLKLNTTLHKSNECKESNPITKGQLPQIWYYFKTKKAENKTQSHEYDTQMNNAFLLSNMMEVMHKKDMQVQCKKEEYIFKDALLHIIKALLNNVDPNLDFNTFILKRSSEDLDLDVDGTDSFYTDSNSDPEDEDLYNPANDIYELPSSDKKNLFEFISSNIIRKKTLPELVPTNKTMQMEVKSIYKNIRDIEIEVFEEMQRKIDKNAKDSTAITDSTIDLTFFEDLKKKSMGDIFVIFLINYETDKFNSALELHNLLLQHTQQHEISTQDEVPLFEIDYNVKTRKQKDNLLQTIFLINIIDKYKDLNEKIEKYRMVWIDCTNSLMTLQSEVLLIENRSTKDLSNTTQDKKYNELLEEHLKTKNIKKIEMYADNKYNN